MSVPTLERGNEGVLAVTAAGALTGSFAGAITGPVSSAGAVFGAVTFALALSGTAAVALTGTASSAFALASTATTSPSTGEKGVVWNILKITGELIRGSGCSISIGNVRIHTGI